MIECYMLQPCNFFNITGIILDLVQTVVPRRTWTRKNVSVPFGSPYDR